MVAKKTATKIEKKKPLSLAAAKKEETSAKAEEKAAESAAAAAKKAAEAAADLLGDDEKRRKACVTKNAYQLITLAGKDRYRIIGKRGEWVSPVGSIRELAKIEARLNLKDPEQKLINKQEVKGKWRDVGTGEIVNP